MLGAWLTPRSRTPADGGTGHPNWGRLRLPAAWEASGGESRGATVSGWHRRGTLTAGTHSHCSRGRRAGRPSIILTLAAPLPPLSRLRGADERTRYGRGRGRGGVIGDRGSPNCRPAAAAPAQGPQAAWPAHDPGAEGAALCVCVCVYIYIYIQHTHTHTHTHMYTYIYIYNT